MRKIIKTLLEWAEHLSFLREWAWPLAVPIMTAAAGYFQSVPLMWIIMATVLTSMGAVIIGLAMTLQLERNNPSNKVQYFIALAIDLNPATVTPSGSRSQRRATLSDGLQALSPTQLNPSVSRTLTKAQIGLELINTAVIPISCYISSAITSLEGMEPGRTKYPKPPFMLLPGSRVRMMDDVIDMNNYAAGKMLGHIDMTIKYGHKGDERNELRVVGNVNVVMEHFGFVSQILLDHIPPVATASPT